jgi:hypothetical protein
MAMKKNKLVSPEALEQATYKYFLKKNNTKLHDEEKENEKNIYINENNEDKFDESKDDDTIYHN